MAKSKAERNLEYYKEKYLEALKAFENEEELRLAALHQPKVNLLNIQHWSAYMQGARKAFLYILEHEGDYDNKVYRDAVFRLITSDLRYMGMFLTESHDICYAIINGTKKVNSLVARLTLRRKLLFIKKCSYVNKNH